MNYISAIAVITLCNSIIIITIIIIIMILSNSLILQLKNYPPLQYLISYNPYTESTMTAMSVYHRATIICGYKF